MPAGLTAVLCFSQVLSLPQRVYMDFRSYPWCPEWLELCAVLARKRGRPPLTFPALGNQGMTLPVIPRYTALEASHRCHRTHWNSSKTTGTLDCSSMPAITCLQSLPSVCCNLVAVHSSSSCRLESQQAVSPAPGCSQSVPRGSLPLSCQPVPVSHDNGVAKRRGVDAANFPGVAKADDCAGHRHAHAARRHPVSTAGLLRYLIIASPILDPSTSISHEPWQES